MRNKETAVDSIRAFVRDNLGIPFLSQHVDRAPDWLLIVFAAGVAFAIIGSVLALMANASRGVRLTLLAVRDPKGAIERIMNPDQQSREIEALRTQLAGLEAKIDAMNRPWIRIPDFVGDAVDGLTGYASGLLKAGRFAELRKRMDEVLAHFPDSNWAKRQWIDATQGLAEDATKRGQFLLAVSRYREAIKKADGLLKNN
jgi:hypothetical protein